MPRSDFKAIMAPKPVVSKVETYRRAKGLPSNSQALAALVEEAGKHDSLLSFIETLLSQMERLVQKATRSEKGAAELVASFVELLKSFLLQAQAQLFVME